MAIVRVDWTFAHLEKTAFGEVDLGGKIRVSVLDLLVGIQVETLSRKLKI